MYMYISIAHVSSTFQRRYILNFNNASIMDRTNFYHSLKVIAEGAFGGSNTTISSTLKEIMGQLATDTCNWVCL